MNLLERKAIFSLATILSLRMIGLFMALPVFTLYMLEKKNASPQLAGLALGIYGLTQGLFQIPLGACSDFFGRKKIITLGLLLFISGSLLIALSSSIQWIIIGRALQGAGAIGSTVIALLSDLIREDQRSKALAFIGMSIGLSFSFALIIGPILVSWIGFNGIFWISAFLGLLALFILFKTTPNPTAFVRAHLSFNLIPSLFNWALIRCYIGIFILHFIFTASFVVLPFSLKNTLHLLGHQQWIIYLPALILAFCLSLIAIIIAEKKQKIKKIFILSVLIIIISQLILCSHIHQTIYYFIAIFLFFMGFSILEALLPSLTSRLSPSTHKGSALGIFSSAQFLGIFLGALSGGWMMNHSILTFIYISNAVLSILWLFIAVNMINPKIQRSLSSSSQNT